MGRRGRPPHPDVLTPREWEVLGLIREGLSNEEIAQRLGISLDGAKYHVSEILSKLGLENRHDAARWHPEERRPWWLAAAAPLLFSRRLPSFGWLSPAVAGGLAVLVAAGIGLLVWALLATRGGEPRTPSGTGLPAGDRLAYISDGDLWLLEGVGPARRLTEKGDIYNPRWSPDGRRLIFLRNEAPPATVPALRAQLPSLWLADVTTEQVRQLDAGPVRLPERPWSPDGERIVFANSTTDGRASSVWLADLNGDSRQLLPAEFGAGDIAWAPDGKTLALARSLPPVYAERLEDRGPETTKIPHENGLYLMNAPGGEPRPVALVEAIARSRLQLPETQPLSVIGVTTAQLLKWSPDGRYVVFQAVTLSSSLDADGVALFSVAVEGGKPVYHGTMLRSSALLDWFPASHRFVFTRYGGRDVTIGKVLALSEAGVPGAQPIAEDPDRVPGPSADRAPIPARSDAWPAVSPDGERIAFQASEVQLDKLPTLDVGKSEGPKEGIWVVDADGADPRQLTSDPNYLDFFPRWSVDGQSILFIRTNGKPFSPNLTPKEGAYAEIWMMRPDGSDAEPLVRDLQRIGSYYGLFAWEEELAWYQGPK